MKERLGKEKVKEEECWLVIGGDFDVPMTNKEKDKKRGEESIVVGLLRLMKNMNMEEQ